MVLVLFCLGLLVDVLSVFSPNQDMLKICLRQQVGILAQSPWVPRCFPHIATMCTTYQFDNPGLGLVYVCMVCK